MHQPRLIIPKSEKLVGKTWLDIDLAKADQWTGEEKGGCSFGSACHGADVVPRPATTTEAM